VKSGPRQLAPMEQRARNEVRARAAGIHLDDLTDQSVCPDEILGYGEGTDFSHRLRASHRGQYRPANGAWVSRSTHEWLDQHRSLALAGGWQLASHQNIHQEPIWLALPYPGWFLIDDLVTDGPHVLHYCDDQPPRPQLPFESNAAYAAFLQSESLKIA
jgi:hypothetical protein